MSEKGFKITDQAGESNSGSILFEGNLTIEHIDAIFKSLESRAMTTKSLNLELANIEDLDLSFCQLLASLIQSRSKTGLITDFNLDISDEMLCVLDNAGILDLLSNLNKEEI